MVSIMIDMMINIELDPLSELVQKCEGSSHDVQKIDLPKLMYIMRKIANDEY